MSAGRIAIQLTSPSWVSGQDPIAVAEVARAPGKKGAIRTAVRLAIGVNDAPQEAVVEEGDYIVRVFMPSGDVQAEQVHVRAGSVEQLHFELEKTPHEWLASAFSFGTAQTLPREGEVSALFEALRRGEALLSVSSLGPHPDRDLAKRVQVTVTSPYLELATYAAQDISGKRMVLNEISGTARVQSIEGWRWQTRLDVMRPLPAERLSTRELVLWWTGNPVGEPKPLHIRQSEQDQRNARLEFSGPVYGGSIGMSAERVYAAIRDPQGNDFYAVYPEGWASTSAGNIGAPVSASVLMTISVEASLTAPELSGSAVRWRCVPEVDDLQAMSLLGFLNVGQVNAGQLILERARDWLYEKTVNPVAAAAGAYLLLMHGEEANARLEPDWRRWVRNLYNWFPNLPDGAIAMAQMALAYGETGRGDAIDVEKLRGYALDAVRRGLPYLGAGVRVLTDTLIAVQGDDESAGRNGPAVDETRRALSLVRQLGRITVPGSFFTVLRLDMAKSTALHAATEMHS